MQRRDYEVTEVAASTLPLCLGTYLFHHDSFPTSIASTLTTVLQCSHVSIKRAARLTTITYIYIYVVKRAESK